MQVYILIERSLIDCSETYVKAYGTYKEAKKALNDKVKYWEKYLETPAMKESEQVYYIDNDNIGWAEVSIKEDSIRG